MTFLNPLILLGLAAAAIPILLHLFNLRKLKRIEFSTLTFLKELQRTKIRRLKLRQLLLLLLRTLIVVTLVLAFSRPTLKGSLAGSSGSQAKTSAVLILDDSYSMTQNDPQGQLLRQAKRVALGIIDLFNQGDELVLLRLSEVDRAAQELNLSPNRDLALLKRDLESTEPSFIHRSLEAALREASRLLSGTTNFNKEIYVISDFQRGLFRFRAAASQPEELLPPGVRVFLVPLGKRDIQNISIESIAIPTTIFEQNRPFAVRVQVSNNSRSAVRDHIVSLFISGTRVAQRGIDLQGESSTSVEFSALPSSTGYIEAFAELEDDDFESDNRRYVVAYIPERIRVLLVGSPPDTRYPRLALETRLSTGPSAIELKEITAPQFSSSLAEQTDVVVLVGNEELTNAQVSQLSSFVRNGKGLIWFPNGSLSQVSFNSSFAPSLGFPLLGGLDRIAAPSANGGNRAFLEFDKADMRHPVFHGLFEDRQSSKEMQSSQPTAARRGIETPRLTSAARLTLTAQSIPIITLSNGSGFLVEQRVGNGRALLYAVAPILEWSDFPRKGLFVPLLHRSVAYVNQQHVPAEETRAGDEVLLKGPPGAAVPWKVRDPANVERTFTPSSSSWQRTLRFSNTAQVGVYSLIARDDVLQKFAVNLDARESEVARVSQEEITATLQRIGIASSSLRYVQQSQELERIVRESRFGLELWKHFLIAALLLAVAEMIVARTGKNERAESTQT